MLVPTHDTGISRKIRGTYFPTFNGRLTEIYTLVTDIRARVTVAAGETVTLTYVVNVH